jgi:hypothetical protein
MKKQSEDDNYLDSIPGFIRAKIIPGINAYKGVCEVCRKVVPAGTGIRTTVKGPFSYIHKIRHKECAESDHLFIHK